jgi:hypothetical protein
MNIDQDYLKGLLEAFQAAPTPTVDICALKAAGFDYNDPKFIFHMDILYDVGLIGRDDRMPGLGDQRALDGHIQWSVLPLRLTAQGHEFLEAIHNKEVWATIKREFKDASIGTLLEVSKALLKGYLQSKIGSILGG